MRVWRMERGISLPVVFALAVGPLDEGNLAASITQQMVLYGQTLITEKANSLQDN
jgi:hypothetical protein